MNIRLVLFFAATAALAQPPQVVEGFAKIVFAHNAHESATVQNAVDYRGPVRGYMTGAWWAPGQVADNRLEWDTAPAPERQETVFRFLGASAVVPREVVRVPEVKLYVNGEYALTFSIGLQRDYGWRKGEYFLQYKAVRNQWPSWGRQRQFELEGNSGLYELRVPASKITPGKPVRLKAEMQPFPRWPNGWFMVKERTDTEPESPASLREQVTQLRRDVNRLSELVQVLASRGADTHLQHFTIHSSPNRHLHPADLIPFGQGELLLTAREATEHVAADGDIVVFRAKEGETKWTPHARFGIPGVDEREACGLQLPDGSLLLAVFYNKMYRTDGEYEQKWAKTLAFGKGKQHMGFYTVRSTDGGRTWSEPVFPSLAGMPFTDTEGPADAPVLLPDGTLLLPLIGYNVRGDIENHAAVLLSSKDQGRTWQYLSTIADDPGGKLGRFHEPGLVRLQSGNLVAAMRNSSGYVWIARSSDNGRTWTKAEPSPMTGHPADLIELSDGRLLCTYGLREPYHSTPGGVRATFSHDGGVTWKVEEEVILRDDFLNWDVGYPESRQLADGRILTVYYFNEQGRYALGGTLWRP